MASQPRVEQLMGFMVTVDSQGTVTLPMAKPNWRYRLISYDDGTIVLESRGPSRILDGEMPTTTEESR